MEIIYAIQYHPQVISDDIPKISPTWRVKISTAIETKLKTAPDLYGKPLRRALKGYRKLRVGDYRVVFLIENRKVVIRAIVHRSTVYTVFAKRMK
jgi:mRNA interferase RelE/StbE